jgi:hypothetical protein
VEWTDSCEAIKHYDSAVRVLPCSESLFQQGRLALKAATSLKQLEAAQQALASAARHEEAEGDNRGEALMMLMRTQLMDESVWGSEQSKRQQQRQQDVRDKLSAMGFCYVLSPHTLIPPYSSPASRRSSDRVRSCLVSVFEDSLQVFCRLLCLFSCSFILLRVARCYLC